MAPGFPFLFFLNEIHAKSLSNMECVPTLARVDLQSLLCPAILLGVTPPTTPFSYKLLHKFALLVLYSSLGPYSLNHLTDYPHLLFDLLTIPVFLLIAYGFHPTSLQAT
nr:hypothetical protein Iba_chr10fCG0560 [Ipomoea batatas]